MVSGDQKSTETWNNLKRKSEIHLSLYKGVHMCMYVKYPEMTWVFHRHPQ
jgi:hypothetical protein